jgi:hypothetical protein
MAGNQHRGAPYGNQRAKGNRGGPGHKSKFRTEYTAQVTRLAMLGYTDEEIGQYFGVAESVICYWQKRHSGHCQLEATRNIRH